MLLKIATAIFLAFVIVVPLTFWILKKVRIKAKVRHVQVLLLLGFSASLFIFLLQTWFALPLVIATISFALVIAAIELTLRRIVASSGIQQTIDMGPNGTQVPFTQARINSGCYPDDYMTEGIWKEMQELLESRKIQSKTKTVQEVAFQNGEREKLIWGYQKYKYVSFHGENYSILNGVRGTTDYVRQIDPKKIFILGGSTVFCEETPDRLTIASFLQRKVNSVENFYEVVNNGWSGAPIVERSKMLEDLINLNPGDLVVFYMGDNDSGFHFMAADGRRRKSEDSFPAVVQMLKLLGTEFGSELANWIYGEIAPRILTKFSRSVVRETIEALTQSEEYCRGRGASMVVILQPNLFTLHTKHLSETISEQCFPTNLKIVISSAYRLYLKWIATVPFAVSAIHIFDNAPAPVFLDWAHVNARGNELIANFIFEELKKRKLISVDEKV